MKDWTRHDTPRRSHRRGIRSVEVVRVGSRVLESRFSGQSAWNKHILRMLNAELLPQCIKDSTMELPIHTTRSNHQSSARRPAYQRIVFPPVLDQGQGFWHIECERLVRNICRYRWSGLQGFMDFQEIIIKEE